MAYAMACSDVCACVSVCMCVVITLLFILIREIVECLVDFIFIIDLIPPHVFLMLLLLSSKNLV